MSRLWTIALFIALLFVANASAVVDVGEVAALRNIFAYLPELPWTGLRLNETCSQIIVPGVTCLQGHVWGLDLSAFSLPNPVGALGDITGLRYLNDLTLGEKNNVSNYDVWHQGLVNLAMLAIDAPDRFGNETLPSWSGDFRTNPKLTNVGLRHGSKGRYPYTMFTNNVTSLVIDAYKAFASPPNFVNPDKLEYLELNGPTQALMLRSAFPSLLRLQVNSPALERIEDFTFSAEFFPVLWTLNFTGCSSLSRFPSTIATLPQLGRLYCDGCLLIRTDSLPPMTNPQLSIVSLRNNRLTSVPDGLCSAPSNRQLMLFFEDNPLTDLPQCWSRLLIVELRLRGAKFTAFPPVLTTSPGIRALTMTQMTTITQPLPDLSVQNNLIFIDLTNAGFSGPFPVGLSASPLLTQIDLGGNHFTGTIPPNFFANMPQIQRLDLGGSRMTGSVPLPSGSSPLCPTLTTLNISGNSFSDLSPHLQNCVRLQAIDFSDNDLKSAPSLSSLFSIDAPPYRSLYYVHLGGNPIFGQLEPNGLKFPSERLPSASFNISGCGFNGTIPKISSSFTYVVDLSNNKLTGSVPPMVESPNYDVRVLLLGGNQLNGTIPDLSTLSRNIQKLDFSRNQLSGVIPVLSGMQNLVSFKANDNPTLTGPFPDLPPSTQQIWVQNTNLGMCQQQPTSIMPPMGQNITDCKATHAGAIITDCTCTSWYSKCAISTSCFEPGVPLNPGSPSPKTGDAISVNFVPQFAQLLLAVCLLLVAGLH